MFAHNKLVFPRLRLQDLGIAHAAKAQLKADKDKGNGLGLKVLYCVCRNNI